MSSMQPAQGSPSLSVIVPVFNHAHYLGEALEAILSQSFKPREVIVIDDGSTDDSFSIMSEWASKHNTVRCIRNERNLGVIASVKRGLAVASSTYVYCAAADDRILPGFFETSMGMLSSFPEAALCCSDPGIIEEESGRIVEHAFRWSERPCFLPPSRLVTIMQGASITGHTSITRRAALDAVGGYRPELAWHTDWFAMHVMAFRFGISYVPGCRSLLRVHPSSYSAAGRKGGRQARVLRRLLRLLRSKEYSDVLPLFIASGVLRAFGWPLVKASLRDPMSWISGTRDVLLPMLCDEGRRRRQIVWTAAPSPVKALYRRFLK